MIQLTSNKRTDTQLLKDAIDKFQEIIFLGDAREALQKIKNMSEEEYQKFQFDKKYQEVFDTMYAYENLFLDLKQQDSFGDFYFGAENYLRKWFENIQKIYTPKQIKKFEDRIKYTEAQKGALPKIIRRRKLTQEIYF